MIPLLRIFPNKLLTNLQLVVNERDNVIKKLIDTEKLIYI